MSKTTKIKLHDKTGLKPVLIGILLFAAIGTGTLLISRGVTPVSIDSTLPNPVNVRAYGDDRVATVMWEEPTNASTKGIVGYYVTWGDKNTGVYTNAKQTQYNIVQIQPLTNGVTYNIKVQSIHGSTVQVSTPWGTEGPTSPEFRADGKVSPGVVTTTAASSARVDQLRTQMSGFFDDFNTAAGPFDELKWNNAASACAGKDSAGAFVNNQFHTHNQVVSNNCDRSQIITRPRTVFDITGKTEANPGVIVMDLDGITHGRDVWYLDLIPTTARKSGIPIDITSHADSNDGSDSDPAMLRFTQRPDVIEWRAYGNNKSPFRLPLLYSCTGTDNFDFAWCGDNTKVAGMSPIAEAPVFARIDVIDPNYIPVPNVRNHWRWEVSPTKLKVFINSTKVLESPMPAEFANTKQFVIHSNIFSYNTGKGDPTAPQTSMFHWDNFGFNGPSTSVVHSYMEGGSTGTTPYLSIGTTAHPMPDAPRSIKVPVPDPIGTPKQARLMFTIGNTGPDNYIWNSTDHILVNGKKYNYPDPTVAAMQLPIIQTYYGAQIAEAYIPFSDSIVINAADLKQGTNDISLNIGQNVRYMGVYNVHLELEYNKGSEPAYTQPKDIFGFNNLMSFVQPAMGAHDNYLFIEQDMGLPTGTIATAPGGSGDTTAPTVSIIAPTNNASVTAGSTLGINVSAQDNVGVVKVEYFIDNQLKHTMTDSPYNHALDTTGMSTGSHTTYVKAYDAAGNVAQSQTVTFSIVASAPPTNKIGDLNNDGSVDVFDLSILLANYGKTVPVGTGGDLNNDSNVTVVDLSIILANYGT